MTTETQLGYKEQVRNGELTAQDAIKKLEKKAGKDGQNLLKQTSTYKWLKVRA